jgi:outer membrane protein OmpA-like peptidoglycan-associated protein
LLFVEGFDEERVGNFPRRLEFIQGNMEVVEWQGARLLRGSDDLNRFAVALPETLPERFTIEFDFFREDRAHAGLYVLFEEFDLSRPWLYPDWATKAYDASQFTVGPQTGVIGPRESLGDGERVRERVTPIRIHVDGSYAKMYVDEKRVANIPNAEFRRSDKVYFYLSGSDDMPAYVGNIRIAAGGGELYDALEANGEVTTKGILFESGSASIRPESTPTLDEIGRMLTDHEDLSLLIEGHTDSVGDETSNQDLSERRAAAVRSHLIETYGIDPGRLQSAGVGESQPVDTNDTPEGRQNNRRVVLKKIS